MKDRKSADKAERRQPTEAPRTESATPKATKLPEPTELEKAQEEFAKRMGLIY